MLKTVGFPSTRTGDQTIIDGNLVIGTAGKGIDFSATPGTGTSELLNDYEEGIWTPSFYGWTGTYASQVGKYVKIGNEVFLQATLVTNGGTGVFSQTYPNIQGLPFAMANMGVAATYGQWNGGSGITPGVSYVNSGSFDYGSGSEWFINIDGSVGARGNLTNTMLSNSTNVQLFITAQYRV